MEDTNEEVKDSLDNLLTVEDFGQMVEQSIVDRIKNNPIETAISLRKNGIINDTEYKDMIIHIRETEIEEDFK